MCGIAGVIDRERRGPQDALLSLASRMAECLVHRGPDDVGSWASPDGAAYLSHRRLSIVDLSPAGRNPMHSADGRLTITFNGEVYNFRELRRELETFGYRFRSATDTEVILAAYDRWGVECLQRFVGMFAFGIWDAPRRRLFVARDRLGKKPVYFAQYGGRLTFASEMKAIVADEAFPREIDPDALSMYLRYGYVPSPSSIYRAARKLPPAHYMIADDDGARVTRYWDPLAVALEGELHVTDDEAADRLTELLRESVRLRMIADVPLGVFLSGGIDSSLVAAIMREVSADPVRTFTIRFENPEYDESPHAAAVARHLGTDHVQETCGVAQMLGLVDNVAFLADEPFADSSLLPTYLVSKVAREHVTVALGGDGGDELFFGYPRYRAYAQHRWLLAAPGLVRRAVAAVASRMPQRRLRRGAEILKQEGGDAYARFVTWWSPHEVERLTGRMSVDNPVYADARVRLARLPDIGRPPLLDLVTYLPEDILTKVDRASMAASLETRSPLLDHRVVEYALRLPLSVKWRNGTDKWLLRRVLYSRVPARLLDRPKMGFGVPLADWFRGPLHERMHAVVHGDLLGRLGVDPAPVREVWTDFAAGRSRRTDVLWSAFALAQWADRWT